MEYCEGFILSTVHYLSHIIFSAIQCQLQLLQTKHPITREPKKKNLDSLITSLLLCSMQFSLYINNQAIFLQWGPTIIFRFDCYTFWLKRLMQFLDHKHPRRALRQSSSELKRLWRPIGKDPNGRGQAYNSQMLGFTLDANLNIEVKQIFIRSRHNKMKDNGEFQMPT